MVSPRHFQQIQEAEMLVEIIKPFPFSRNGTTAEHASPGTEVDIPDALVPGLTSEGFVRETKAMAGAPENKGALRDDGPTVAQYVETGYLAANYPPQGYTSRSTAEEIAAAIAAQTPALTADEIANMSKDEVLEKLGADWGGDKRLGVEKLRVELIAALGLGS